MRGNQPTDVFKKFNMHGGDRSVCWEWKGKVNKSDGRPYFTVQGRKRPAYTIVLELSTGILQEEAETEDGSPAVARHSCDNKICGNLDHLSWGSHQANMNDMVERERHGIPNTVVRSIRKLLKEGRTHICIADLYGLSREAVTAINNNRSHKDVAEDS